MNSIKIAQGLLLELEQEKKAMMQQRILEDHRKTSALAHLKVIVDECSSATPDVVKILRTALKAANELED
jgi:hypothetical protein